jgi:hypothetical protein
MAAKLRLDTDALRVESFSADSLAGNARGTVHAHVTYTAYGNQTCRPYYTCPECAPIDTR